VIGRLSPVVVIGFALLVPRPAAAQGEPASGRLDSIAVVGNRRVTRNAVVQASGLTLGRTLSYRDIQRAIQDLYATGQFDDIRIAADTAAGQSILVVSVRERPVLLKWTVRGVTHLAERTVKDKVELAEGRPMDPAALERARGRIDSVYRTAGFYLAQVRALRVYANDSMQVRVVFDVNEGRRVAIARLRFEGNGHFRAKTLAGEMKTRPEGFWWFRGGSYDDDKLRTDLTERLPKFYGERGYVDFQVLDDTLIVNDTTGKATLVVKLSEGEPYKIGGVEIVGNRRFSTEDVQRFNPFPTVSGAKVAVFNQDKWDDATNKLRTLYWNNGYIYSNVRADVTRRTGPDGKPMVDLRWVITEGQPAIVNKIEIAGNDVTHERVIRDAIVLLPGDVYRQDMVLRSYQNIGNLGFFQQPMPFPDTKPANDQGDVDVIFRVTEKRTGNVNFGASVGQGTGLGGFLGLDEPNLFGRGKRGHFQWQFGKNINDFDISYYDPAVRETRISAQVDVHNTRLRYTIADLGQLRRRGGSLQLGFPAFRDRYTRLFVSYGLDEQTFTGSASNLAFSSVYGCRNCLRSTLGVTVTRDTRIDLPFATAGTYTSFGLSQSGGPLGGTGNFQRIDLEGRWYAPLGQLGGKGGGSPLKFVMGLSTRSGFVFGNSPFFDQLFTLGGTQFGIPLRGYDEFSITPQGYDPSAAGGGQASPAAFGKAFFTMTGEVGLRLSQMFYVSTFYDAGNVWARAGEYNPTRLFRGAGVGVSVISPLGPLGIDYAYGFDKTDLLGRPKPGWKLHFKIGNFF
jgi:outer membrane protein insertion porin family